MGTIVKDTGPLPEPLEPEVIVSQFTLLTAVHPAARRSKNVDGVEAARKPWLRGVLIQREGQAEAETSVLKPPGPRLLPP
jgi:hypothetical protein